MSRTLYRIVFVVMNLWYRLFLPFRVEGLENVPREGGFILVSNHISARDPIYLSACCRTRALHFMAKAELFRFKPLAFVIRKLGAFPVDRGHSDLNAVRTALNVIREGHGLGMFPQGTRSRDNTPTPMLSGASMIALRAGAPVIPAFIDGPYRPFRRTRVCFGAPIDLSGFGRRMDSQTLDAATRRIEAAVWNLKK